MIELLVIIVIMGVLAGVMLPRISAGGNRRGEVEAESVRVMLSRLGEKDAFSVSPLALIYEGETAVMRMEMRKVDDKEQDVWVKAPLIQPLTLVSLKMNATAVDGQILSPKMWRVEFPGGQSRARLSLCLESARGGAWQIDLLPGELFARKRALGDAREWNPTASPLDNSAATDLDAQGGRTTVW